MKKIPCRNCKSSKLENIFSLGKLFYTGKFLKKNLNPRKGPIDVVICSKCKLVQLKNNFDLKYLYGPDYGYRTGINSSMTKHVKSVAKMLSIKTKLQGKDAALDIASNDATLLDSYSKKVITFGVDPLAKKYLKNYKNINYKISDFFSAAIVRKKFKGTFKIITALSVFYDLRDPNKFLNDAEVLLNKDGIMLLEFADLASIIKFNMFDTFCHEHLEYYSSKIIQKMCSKNNLRLFDMKTNNINGGSTQYFICKTNSKYKNNTKSINKIFKAENQMSLENKSTYIKFVKNIDKNKKKLKKIIYNLKNNGKTIHGYGASTKGNVLLQYFNISNSDIDYVADRNPMKHNLYTPGSKIKIISENESRKMKPDYFIVLPWHFKSEILKREKKTITNGSKFIFPLPNLKIY